MRKLSVVLAAVAMMFLGAGAADAGPARYTVSKSWTLAYVGPDRTPTVIPHIEDDVVEVTCRHGDHMTRYRLNNPALNGGAFPRVDGTGIQIEPEWTGKDQILTVTVTCRRR